MAPTYRKPIISGPVLDKPFPSDRKQSSSRPALATRIYSLRPPVRNTPARSPPVSIVCVSDTHNQRPELPDGDLLLHAGDLTQHGSFNELKAQLDWLNKQKHQFKVIIGGNHDLLLDRDFVDRFPERIHESPGKKRSDLSWGSVIYLQNESRTLTFPNGRQLKIYGSPQTPQFGNWAFQYPPIRDVFSNTIPADTDILLTHGPPRFHLGTQNAPGCGHLLREIWRIHKGLSLVVFGHIHAGYGSEVVTFDSLQRYYEDSLMGNKVLTSLLALTMALVWRWILHSLPARALTGQNTRLVNAAIARGPQNLQSNEPITLML